MVKIVLNVFGALVLTGFFGLFIGGLVDSDGAEFVNPIYLKKRFHINWFGAYMLALIFNVIAVSWVICYWVYKICTINA